jgi:hypothetical protein
MTQVSMIVDARGAHDAFMRAGDVSALVEAWRALEPTLLDTTLRAGMKLGADIATKDGNSLGRIVIAIVSPHECTVDAKTQFAIVAVRERPQIAAPYRCGTCAAEHVVTYGPFICRRCPEERRRVCDEHVVLLPGSLEGTCPEHHPRCLECDESALIWCPGPKCRSTKAWCEAHIVHRRAGEDDVAYCRSCHEDLFPRCEHDECKAVASLSCRHVTDSGRLCGTRVCPRHATLWQVFGPKRPGLARCREHRSVSQLTPEGVVLQILGACSLKKLRPPSLPSLRYVLMRTGGRNGTLQDALNLVERCPDATPVLGDTIRKLVLRELPGWRKAAADSEAAQAESFAALLSWLTSVGRHSAATTAQVTGWGRPRVSKTGILERRGMLFVRVDPRFFPREARDQASRQLGFDVRLERQP